MIRKERKTRKKRGSRTAGYGRVSSGHRKSGQRGGKGNVGKREHHWILSIKRGDIRQRGFVPPTQKKEKVISLAALSTKVYRLRKFGKLPTYEGLPLIDVKELGFDRVISKGLVTEKFALKAPYITENAREKLTKAGCIIVEKEE